MLVAGEPLEKLEAWLDANGWEGYDPYDIKGTPVFLLLGRWKYTDWVAHRFFDRFPNGMRWLFRVKRAINPKAMGLLARGYLRLYSGSKDQPHLKKAKECLDWLLANPSKGYSGLCWGYPFDWQSRGFVPRGTPSIVVTSVCAHAMLDAHEALGDEKYLKAARSCCEFIIKDLNRDETADALCFSYTPLDRNHVHNANLLGASVLARLFKATGESELSTLAVKSVNFTVKHQNPDGSFYYWAPPDEMLRLVDNYHTGFVLEALNVCRRALGPAFKHESQLRKGLDFYASNLFTPEGAPKLSTAAELPHNIHGCAQGIITFKELADLAPAHEGLALKIKKWTVANMQNPDGSFAYQLHRKGYVDRTPYIRWGQAWMLLALSYFEAGDTIP